MNRRFASIVLVLLLALAWGIPSIAAQDDPAFTEQQVIDMVTADSEVAHGLEGTSNWTAAAYNTRNSYGIWHVQFWDAEGEDLGWVEIQPAQNIIYSSETHFPISEAYRRDAEPILRDFVAANEEVRRLIARPQDYEMYVDYNGWEKVWGVYVDNGSDSLYVTVSFTEDSFDAPQLENIYFSEVLSFDDWYAAMKAEVTAIAFEQSPIAGALRGVENWQTEVERLDAGDTWSVSFMAQDAVLVRATVDTLHRTVTDYQLGG